MAYEARLSDYARGGVAGQAMVEGTPVKLVAGGLHGELPTLVPATAGETSNVFILLAAVDNFSRPTDARLYTANWYTQDNRYGSDYADPIKTTTVYETGMSTLWSPTIPSGALAVAKRGGTYAVPSGMFVDSANIRVPGAKIAVGTNVWTYTATETGAVGIVEEYNEVNQVLIFSLKH